MNLNNIIKILKSKGLLCLVLCGIVIYSALHVTAFAQYVESKLLPPPSVPDKRVTAATGEAQSDSVQTRFRVKETIPADYDNLSEGSSAIDLKTPKNITTEAEYDAVTGMYVVRTKLGDKEITTPFMLSADEYNNIELRKSMQEYYRARNSLSAEENKKDPFSFLDMQFGLGPLDKVFGPGGVQLKTQGSVKINMGIKSNKTDNPALSVDARRKTYFDFDQQVQANINASVGDKMKFDMSYNTGATFDFDNKNLKLAYEGKEDEIIKNIEAGNVSMTTGSSLIRGSTSLFGVKTKLQFGKLTATALVSQQNSQTQTVNSRGGAQTQKFTVTADSYDQNRHYFLSHWFRDNYDKFASTLPLVSSGINITRIEVWVTNKRNDYSQSRNVVAFMDLGENRRLANSHWVGNAAFDVPCNASNNLVTEISTSYPDARYIEQVATSAVNGYAVAGRFIDFGTQKYMAAATYLNKSATTLAEGALSFANITDGISNITPLFYPTDGLGTTRNTQFMQSVCYEPTTTGLNIWVLSALQGIAHYAYPAPTVVPDPEPEEPTEPIVDDIITELFEVWNYSEIGTNLS